MSTRQVRERIRIARALEHLPKTMESFRRGEVSFSAVREITRVAVPATEASWLEICREYPIRQIERLVKASKHGEVPKRPSLGLPRGLMPLKLKVTPEQMAIVETLCERYEADTGKTSNVVDVLFEALEKVVNGEASSETTPNRSNGKSGSRPNLIYVRCKDCGNGAISTREGFVETTTDILDEVEEFAHVRDASGDMIEGDAISVPSTPEAPLEERDEPTPPALRDLVLARDGKCCTVPGCSERSELQVHHVRWRRHGGRTIPDNLTSLCPNHHGCVHAGTLILSGSHSRGWRFTFPREVSARDSSLKPHVGHPLDASEPDSSM